MKTYYDNDVSFDILKNKTIAVIGYGSQGHAHAQNLRDSGLNVLVANHKDTPNGIKAKKDGFEVLSASEATEKSDFIMMLTQDEKMADIYKDEIEPYMRPGQILGFGHGFNIHFGLITPRKDTDVVLVACKAQGSMIRRAYVHGGAVTSLFDVYQDYSGHAKEYALAYAKAVGTTKAGALECSFEEETVTNLVGEQTVLVGGIMELIIAGYNNLREAGYSPETAYFETCHEVKLITDIIFEGGLTKLVNGISNTAMFGGFMTGPKVIVEESKKSMKEALKNIQSGSFSKTFLEEIKKDKNLLTERRKEIENLEIEKIGKKLRKSMGIE